MDIYQYLITALLSLVICSTVVSSAEINKETISSGVSVSEVSFGNKVVSDKEELLTVWKGLAIDGEPPNPDFQNELVILITADSNSNPGIRILRFERKADDNVIITYGAESEGFPSQDVDTQGVSYLISKIHPLKTEGLKVKFIDESIKGGIPAGTSIGHIPPYEGVTRFDKGLLVAAYIPLDKGNEWTYSVVSNSDNNELIQSIVAESYGWSIFDSFFGVKNLGMRVSLQGEIYLISKSVIKTFYPTGTEKIFAKSDFTTPAGTFNDIMIVTIPDMDGIYFKDVYAKGVGLIYHKHKAPTGTVEYKLKKANVRGIEYPK